MRGPDPSGAVGAMVVAGVVIGLVMVAGLIVMRRMLRTQRRRPPPGRLTGLSETAASSPPHVSTFADLERGFSEALLAGGDRDRLLALVRAVTVSTLPDPHKRDLLAHFARALRARCAPIGRGPVDPNTLAVALAAELQSAARVPNAPLSPPA